MNAPSRETWERLFDAAVRLKDMAPWEWMTEENLFGVVDPDTGEVGFVSVMGALGEHLAVAVYRGAVGLLGFSRLESGEMEDRPEALFEVPQIQVSFENRDQLDKDDRQIIKDLGLRFRGRNAWPRFRAFRPGWEPVRPSEPEARFLAVAVEQLLHVAPRVAEDPSILFGPEPGTFLHRVARKKGRGLRWEDRYLAPPELPERSIPIPLDPELAETVAALPVGLNEVEVEVSLLPVPVGKRRGERFYPLLLLVADARTGLVAHVDTLEPADPFEDTYGELPQALLEGFARMGQRPRRVRVRPGLLGPILKAVREELPWLQVEEAEVLPAADAAREALVSHLAYGGR